MKKLKVPYLENLDELEMGFVESLLETQGGRAYIDTVNWESYPYQPIAAFDVARSAKRLYIHFFSKGLSLKAAYQEDGSPVYQDSCVEFFVQPPGEKKYFNFEFNCIGVCDASYRVSRDAKESLKPAQYESIKRYASLPFETFPEKKGIFSWDLLVSVPFEVMGLNPDHLPETLRANFYKCADNTDYPHYLSWNPIDLEEPNFHCPEFFGELDLTARE